MSLSSSIFGSKDVEDKKEEKSSGKQLTSLFDSSAASSLPAKPNKLNFTETQKERERRERKEEKRKKRKSNREASEEAPAVTVTPSPDEKKSGKKRKTENKEGSTEDSKEGDAATAEKTEETTESQKKASEEERTIFVGNLPLNLSRKALASIFKDCGKVKSTRFRSVATAGLKVAQEHAGNQNLVKKISANTNNLLEDVPKNTSQGYVVFASSESIEAALKMNNKPAPGSEGRLLRVDRATPTRDSTRSVFVGNLPYSTDEKTLREHFCEKCGWNVDDGNIEGIRIVRDKETMQCKGFGYVLLKDKSCVPPALELHESVYMKRNLRVMVCGKRFKGRKGAAKEGEVFDGVRRRLKNKPAQKEEKSVKELLLSANKEKKKRGVKKNTTNSNGMSKRAASDRKLDKRVKKIQKRVEKGMGKTKKG